MYNSFEHTHIRHFSYIACNRREFSGELARRLGDFLLDPERLRAETEEIVTPRSKKVRDQGVFREFSSS